MNSRGYLLDATRLRHSGNKYESIEMYQKALQYADDDLSARFVALYRLGLAYAEVVEYHSWAIMYLENAWNIGLDVLKVDESGSALVPVVEVIGKNLIRLFRIVNSHDEASLLEKKYNFLFGKPHAIKARVDALPNDACSNCKDASVPIIRVHESGCVLCEACAEEKREEEKGHDGNYIIRYRKEILFDIGKMPHSPPEELIIRYKNIHSAIVNRPKTREKIHFYDMNTS